MRATGYRSLAERHDGCDDYVIVQPSLSSATCEGADSEKSPAVSFCIPTLNSERTIGACLRSIIFQDYEPLEIIVVDGGSSDRTIEIAAEYTHHIFFDEGTLGSARQTSIDHSTGEIIALFDDDIIIPHAGWLRHAVQYFYYSERISTVWPVVVAPPHASLTARLYANLWRVAFQYRIRKGHGNCGGGNALFLKRCVEEIGGVDQSLCWGEDFDWAARLKAQRYKVVLIEDPLYHDTMHSLGEFAKKQRGGAAAFTKDHFFSTGLSSKDVVYEQFVLGTRGMVQGLLRERDPSWALFPLFALIRTIAFGGAYVEKVFKHDI